MASQAGIGLSQDSLDPIQDVTFCSRYCVFKRTFRGRTEEILRLNARATEGVEPTAGSSVGVFASLGREGTWQGWFVTRNSHGLVLAVGESGIVGTGEGGGLV